MVDTSEKLLESPAVDSVTLVKLKQAQGVNLDAIYQSINIQNPYSPYTPLNKEACDDSINCSYASDNKLIFGYKFPAQQRVYEWFISKIDEQAQAPVCALKFIDDNRYELKNFANQNVAQQAGYQVTHFQQCGACSSLQDLAVYAEKDLTFMARACSKVLDGDKKLQCMRDIGFSNSCAQAWAYNASHTSFKCGATCVKQYGLVNIILGIENLSNTDENGNLNACLLCDELMSGPGFQYAAGRTRRNSGIYSEIDRPEEQVYQLEHNYFAE